MSQAKCRSCDAIRVAGLYVRCCYFAAVEGSSFNFWWVTLAMVMLIVVVIVFVFAVVQSPSSSPKKRCNGDVCSHLFEGDWSLPAGYTLRYPRALYSLCYLSLSVQQMSGHFNLAMLPAQRQASYLQDTIGDNKDD